MTEDLNLGEEVTTLPKEKQDKDKKKLTITAEEVKDEFLTKQKSFFGFKWGKKKKVTAEELDEESPLLFYIDENLDIDVYKNISVGAIHPKDGMWGEKEYTNLVEARKRCKFKYGGREIPVYINYVNERYGYPIEPRLDAEATYKAIKILQANYKEYDESQAGLLRWKEIIKMTLIFIGGGIGIALIALYIGKLFGIWDMLGWFKPIATAAVNQTANVTNSTAQLVQQGAVVIP